jgi:UDP-glucose 4-epimerase
VTGGAGFIGAHLVERLLAAGWSVRVLDDFSSGRDENLRGVCERIEVRRGDVRDAEGVAQAMQGVEVVFHQAAVPSVPRSVADPLGTDAVNLGGTLRVLEAARGAGVRRVVLAASSSAYGDSALLPKREDMPPEPLSPYALQKYAGEVYARLYSRLYGLETVALRYFNVFGPRQDPQSEYAAVVPRFVCAALDDTPPTIYGDGEQTRDFTFVSDAAEANLRAADAPGVAGAVFNVASGNRTSLNSLWAHIREIVGSRIEARHAPVRAGDVRDSLADLTRARDLLGYRPAVSLREGLCRTVESLRSARPS